MNADGAEVCLPGLRVPGQSDQPSLRGNEHHLQQFLCSDPSLLVQISIARHGQNSQHVGFGRSLAGMSLLEVLAPSRVVCFSPPIPL